MRAILVKNNTISYKEKIAIQRLLLWQIAVFVTLSGLSVLLFGRMIFQSVALGGLIAVIPNIFLAVFIFARADKRSSKQVVNACYIGELLKLVLITLMMSIALHYWIMQLGPLLVGFIGSYSVYWFSLKSGSLVS